MPNFRKFAGNFNTAPSVAIFSRLDNPHVRVSLRFKFCVFLNKVSILWVILRFYVEGHRNGHTKWVVTKSFIVDTHVHEESFLVGQMKVILKAIVHQSTTWVFTLL